MRLIFLTFLFFFQTQILYSVEFKGKFEQGSFIIGKTDPGSKVFIEKKNKSLKARFFCIWS